MAFIFSVEVYLKLELNPNDGRDKVVITSTRLVLLLLLSGSTVLERIFGRLTHATFLSLI
jgi:hypothetical protein